MFQNIMMKSLNVSSKVKSDFNLTLATPERIDVRMLDTHMVKNDFSASSPRQPLSYPNSPRIVKVTKRAMSYGYGSKELKK